MPSMETTPEYVFGSAITFETSKAFTAVDGTTIVDPDEVFFGFQIDGDPSLTFTFKYTYGIGDPTGTIVRTGLGLYKATINTIAQSNGAYIYTPGVWVYSIACAPNPAIAHDPTQTQARLEDQIIVKPNSFTFA